MRALDTATSAKRRGTYNTPSTLVTMCLDRARELLRGRTDISVLEPSAGDGAFIAGLAAHPLGRAVSEIVAVEPDPSLAIQSTTTLGASGLAGAVWPTSALNVTLPISDLVIGNPPFVRFQYVDAADRTRAGAANLWIRVFQAAATRVRPGGAIVLVLPGELLSGVTAGPIRRWLIQHLESVRVELVAPDTFPDVLVEVLVVSGRVAAQATDDTVFELVDGPVCFTHRVKASEQTWSRLMLAPHALSAYDDISHHQSVARLGDVAQFELGAITGANDWFGVDAETVARYELQPWALPMLSRSRHAPGLEFTGADHAAIVARGERSYLLDFARGPDPLSEPGPARYIADGAVAGIADRYKCRIRSVWYRVPGVRAAPLALAKRANRFPYLVHNTAGAVTTDTVYRGRVNDAALDDADVVAAFTSSITLLSAEVEGRVLGGGALELVPSALARLLVVRRPGLGATLPALDRIARTRYRVDADDAVVDGADRLIVSRIEIDPELVTVLRAARDVLLERRRARPGA